MGAVPGRRGEHLKSTLFGHSAQRMISRLGQRPDVPEYPITPQVSVELTVTE
jgi:hypothetical protein